MKNITLSADEHLIEQARKKAASENTTLNAEFRQWLASYAAKSTDGERRTREYRSLMAEFAQVDLGGPYTRNDLNER